MPAVKGNRARHNKRGILRDRGCPLIELDLLKTVDTIAKKSAGFKSLADSWADTTTPRRLMRLADSSAR
jgi:hypothetical protein